MLAVFSIVIKIIIPIGKQFVKMIWMYDWHPLCHSRIQTVNQIDYNMYDLETVV